MVRTGALMALLFGAGAFCGAAFAASPPAPAVGSTFKDCSNCPEMVVVPAGSFLMGSTAEDEAREGLSPRLSQGRGANDKAVQAMLGWSLPQHKVTIAKPFAVGKFHVTHGQFAAFVADTHRPDPAMCGIMNMEGDSVQTPGGNWHNTGYKQSDDDPVTCTAWEDAKAYADWLSAKTGKPYRLLSEAEYEYAARAGTTGQRFWGNNILDACKYANVADRALHGIHPSLPWIDCSDGYANTGPDGKFLPNAFGLYGMLGNAYQWVADCAHTNYDGAPTDGSAWMTGPCDRHGERGGAWFTGAYAVRAPKRGFNTPTARNNDNGFRIARDL
jgi:formylglycine-generating enzyme required for sulfatase activity